MASEISSSHIKRKNRPGFMTLLSSAVCEWFLITLLFVEAALSYLLTQFARYCDLKPPCPLCSRIEALSSGHKKKTECFYTLLCLNHKEQISSVTSCSVHNKLADLNNMCEECLSPLEIQKNSSSPGSYRLFLGKLWVDIDKSLLQSLINSKRIQLGSLGHGTCSCCNKPWRAKSNTDRLMHDLKAVGLGASKANVKPPLPRVPGRSRFGRRDSFKRLRDKITGLPLDGEKSVDTLSHVGYTKLKLGSDTESEFPFSEDEDDDGKRSCVRSDDEVCYGPKTEDNLQKPFVFDQPDLLIDDLDWEKSCQKEERFITEELITVDEVSHVPLAPQSQDLSALNELLSLNTDISSSDIAVIGKKYIEVEPAIDAASVNAEELEANDDNNLNEDPIKNKENEDLPFEEEVEQVETTTSDKAEEFFESSPEETDDLPFVEEVEQTNVMKSAKMEKDFESSPEETEDLPFVEEVEQIETTTSDRAEEESSPEETEDLPFEDAVEETNVMESAKMEDNLKSSSEESQRVSPESQSRTGEQVKSHTTSPTLVSPKGKSDDEGEDSISHLKKEVEHYQSCMNSLYKELEEERNAAAIAANEAMSMITRLQEEKAALHMEALQYLRMMEEQAQYDSEALDRANDLLNEREKELQDLEAELDFYRNNLADESVLSEIGREDLILDDGTENGEVTSHANLSNDLPSQEGTSLNNNMSAEDDIEMRDTHESNVSIDRHEKDGCDEVMENEVNVNSMAGLKQETAEIQERLKD